ncbi:MAG: hypothetical protein ACXIU7_00810 [Roseinatronobacter sp.]
MPADLEAALDALAASHETTTYGALAAALGLDGPGRIARLTRALEALMDVDTSAGRPLRAALVLGRASGSLPARGFFEHAARLGHDIDDPSAFHRAQLEALFSPA